MSTEIATIPTPKMADISGEYAEILMLGNVLQKSGYFKDVRDQAQAVTKILFGRELGFSPIVSMSGIYVIEGKPALSANLLASCIKRSGKYDYRVKAWDVTKCVLTFREKVDGKWEDVGESSFTVEDAKSAKVLAKDNWSKYPKAMLFARALSQGERAYCPDVSMCALYVPEELGATVNESGEVQTAQDLPKSARPVEVTQEDIPLDSPAKGAASTPVAAAILEQQLINKTTSNLADIVGDKLAVELCGKAENTSYFANIRKALPEPLKAQAETFGREYLKHRKLTKKDGTGSLQNVEKLLFPEIMREALEYVAEVAKTVNG